MHSWRVRHWACSSSENPRSVYVPWRMATRSVFLVAFFRARIALREIPPPRRISRWRASARANQTAAFVRSIDRVSLTRAALEFHWISDAVSVIIRIVDASYLRPRRIECALKLRPAYCHIFSILLLVSRHTSLDLSMYIHGRDGIGRALVSLRFRLIREKTACTLGLVESAAAVNTALFTFARTFDTTPATIIFPFYGDTRTRVYISWRSGHAFPRYCVHTNFSPRRRDISLKRRSNICPSFKTRVSVITRASRKGRFYP